MCALRKAEFFVRLLVFLSCIIYGIKGQMILGGRTLEEELGIWSQGNDLFEFGSHSTWLGKL